MPITNIDDEQYEEWYRRIDNNVIFQLYRIFKFHTFFPILRLAGKNERCIDIGCAKGHFLAVLKERGYTNLAGLDIKNCLYPDLKNDVVFYEQSICARDFSIPAKFDNVIVQSVLHHLPVDSLGTAADNLLGLLKKNGTLFIFEPNIESVIGNLFYCYFLRLFSPPSYREMMEEKKEHHAFCAAWPEFVKKLKASGIHSIKESNFSFYKIFIGRK